MNDDHGHEAGDAVLVAIADVLRGLCTSADVVARYGGDEFVVVLADDADPAVFADRLLAEVAAWPWDVVSPGLAVTVSAGYASGPDAFARADLALRDAKARRPACRRRPAGIGLRAVRPAARSGAAAVAGAVARPVARGPPDAGGRRDGRRHHLTHLDRLTGCPFRRVRGRAGRVEPPLSAVRGRMAG